MSSGSGMRCMGFATSLSSSDNAPSKRYFGASGSPDGLPLSCCSSALSRSALWPRVTPSTARALSSVLIMSSNTVLSVSRPRAFACSSSFFCCAGSGGDGEPQAASSTYALASNADSRRESMGGPRGVEGGSLLKSSEELVELEKEIREEMVDRADLVQQPVIGIDDVQHGLL